MIPVSEEINKAILVKLFTGIMELIVVKLLDFQVAFDVQAQCPSCAQYKGTIKYKSKPPFSIYLVECFISQCNVKNTIYSNSIKWDD